MAKIGKNAATGGGGKLGVSPVIQGGDTGGHYVWVVFVGAVRLND